MTMKTLHPDVEILDIDEGFCCECFEHKTVLTSVVHISRAPSEVISMCAACLDGYVSE